MCVLRVIGPEVRVSWPARRFGVSGRRTFDSPVSAPHSALWTLRSTRIKVPLPLTLALGIWKPPVRVTPFPAGAGRAPGSGAASAVRRPPARVSRAVCSRLFAAVRVPRLHSPLPLSPAAPASATCPPRVVPRLVHSKRPHNITATKRSVVYYKNLVRVRVRVRVSANAQ